MTDFDKFFHETNPVQLARQVVSALSCSLDLFGISEGGLDRVLVMTLELAASEAETLASATTDLRSGRIGRVSIATARVTSSDLRFNLQRAAQHLAELMNQRNYTDQPQPATSLIA